MRAVPCGPASTLPLQGHASFAAHSSDAADIVRNEMAFVAIWRLLVKDRVLCI